MKYESFHVQQLPKRNNRWQARLKYKDNNGGWKETTKLLPKEVKSKRVAKKLAEAWFDEMNEAAELSPTFNREKTVGEVIDDYMDYQLRCGELEESTYHNRKYTYNSLVKPYIGDISFISLDRTAIMSWLTKLNALGLTQGTIGTAFYTVRKTYNYYYEMGELARNPFQGVKPPRKGDARITHLTKDQMEHFIKCLENEKPKFRIACYLAFYAGLRRGEICGLRWRDIDLELGTISITSAVGIGDKAYTKQPKNKTSIRTFPMVPQLVEELKKNVEKPNYFVIGKGTDYVSPATLSWWFKTFVNKYNIVDAYGKPITLHSLRHNLGTVGINSGMDIASLSKMMGHASRAMTLDTYGDASKDAMIVATEKLGNEFGEVPEEKKLDLETVRNLTEVYENKTLKVYVPEEKKEK